MRLAICLVGCALVSLLGWTLWPEPALAPFGGVARTIPSAPRTEPRQMVPAGASEPVAAVATPSPPAPSPMPAARALESLPAAEPPAPREFGPWREVEPGVLTTQRWVLVQRADGSVEQKFVTMRARAVFEPLPGASRLDEAAAQPPR